MFYNNNTVVYLNVHTWVHILYILDLYQQYILYILYSHIYTNFTDFANPIVPLFAGLALCFGSLVIRVARICTVSHYKTKPLSGASIGGKSEEVKSRSEKLWIGRRGVVTPSGVT